MNECTDDLAELFPGGSSTDPDEDYGGWSDTGSGYFADTCFYMQSGGAHQNHIDIDALGPSPEAEIIWASRGICAQPPIRRLEGSQEASPRQVGPPVDAALLQVAQVPLRTRAECLALQARQADMVSNQSRKSKDTGPVTSRSALENLSANNLVRLGAQFRRERANLDTSLLSKGDGQAVIDSLSLPLFKKTNTQAAPAAARRSSVRGGVFNQQLNRRNSSIRAPVWPGG